MSLVTVSKKRNRVYRRRFDHDEARRLRNEEGLSYTALAKRFGVSPTAVQRVCDLDVRTRMEETRRRHLYTACSVCGGPASKYVRPTSPRPDGVVLCTRCAAKENRTRFRYDELGALAAVRCTTCKRWLEPGEFCRARGKSESLHGSCRACNTAHRRERRLRRRVPCLRCGRLRSHPDDTHKRGYPDSGLCADCHRRRPRS